MPDELGFFRAFRVHDVIGLDAPIGPDFFPAVGRYEVDRWQQGGRYRLCQKRQPDPCGGAAITDQLSSPGEPVENRQPSIAAAAPAIAAKL